MPCAVPLGIGVQVTAGGGGDWRKGSCEPTWLDLAVGSERVRLPARDPTRVGAYEAYVEHGWAPGIPGTYECAAITHSDSRAGVAAMRSAILLAHDGATLTDWDLGQHRCIRPL